MIPAAPGYWAVFENAQRPVVAWDLEGYALVIDPGRGRLARAADAPSFRWVDYPRRAAPKAERAAEARRERAGGPRTEAV